MSVASTISTTRALSSLQRKQPMKKIREGHQVKRRVRTVLKAVFNIDKRTDTSVLLHLLPSVSQDFINTWWPSEERNYQSVKVIPLLTLRILFFLKAAQSENTSPCHFGLKDDVADVASCLPNTSWSTQSPLHRQARAAAIAQFCFVCLPAFHSPPFLSVWVSLGCVSLTSSHLSRGCRGCSFRHHPAAGGRLRWHGDSPTLSGRCTGWLCRTWQTKQKGVFFSEDCRLWGLILRTSRCF